MRFLLLLPLLLMPAPAAQNPPTNEEAPPLTVTSFRCVKDRKSIDNAVSVLSAPAPAMIAANKNFEKQKRVNDPAGSRDTNADTLDGRSAALDRIVQESRAPQPVDGFTYSMKVQNASGKVTQTIFWEYRFLEAANPKNLTRRQFLCSARINPDKGKDLQAFSLLGPSDVVDIKSLSKASADQFMEGAFINRVEYSDGSFWQRKDWNVDDLKLTSKARSETRNMPMCRSL
jgi:hypothetical protein